MFPADECSQAEGNGALGRFLGWDHLGVPGMGPYMGTGGVLSEPLWPFSIWEVRRGSSCAFQFSKPGIFPWGLIFFFLHPSTGNPDLLHVEGGLFYEGPFFVAFVCQPVPQSSSILFLSLVILQGGILCLREMLGGVCEKPSLNIG